MAAARAAAGTQAPGADPAAHRPALACSPYFRSVSQNGSAAPDAPRHRDARCASTGDNRRPIATSAYTSLRDANILTLSPPFFPDKGKARISLRQAISALKDEAAL
ncbi:MAG: hypothetical protein WHU94_10695 [Thermogemmata sp.]